MTEDQQGRYTAETREFGSWTNHAIIVTAPDGQRLRLVSADRKIWPLLEAEGIAQQINDGELRAMLAGDYELEPAK